MKLRQKTHLLSETPKLGNIIYGHSPEKNLANTYYEV